MFVNCDIQEVYELFHVDIFFIVKSCERKCKEQ